LYIDSYSGGSITELTLPCPTVCTRTVCTRGAPVDDEGHIAPAGRDGKCRVMQLGDERAPTGHGGVGVTGPDTEILTDVQVDIVWPATTENKPSTSAGRSFGFSQRADRRLRRELYRVAARADVARSDSATPTTGQHPGGQVQSCVPPAVKTTRCGTFVEIELCLHPLADDRRARIVGHHTHHPEPFVEVDQAQDDRFLASAGKRTDTE